MIKLSIPLFFLLSLLGCTSIETQHVNDNLTFYVQTDKNAPTVYEDKNKNWVVNANIVSTITKPKTYYYDFSITTKSQVFDITDIDYKYGDYGKWRIIDKAPYLQGKLPTDRITSIKAFPITIKKSGKPHNQLLRITINTNENKTKHINLVFGVNKCLSKKSKEFVCF